MHTAFCIADGRTCFYQWDVNQQMLVADETIKELHFCNGTSECSLVCKVEDGKADVPNILLQSARSISVYGYTGDHTKIQKIFRVNPRTKPEDYVYTETEVKRYEALEKRVDALEKVEPPAPYVLPTASAEVKGGVKVGNGLRMDGEVLGVVPEGKWERIEKFTVEEENLTNIRRTAFPDGTVYNLSAAKVIVKMHCPVSAAYGTRVDFTNNNSTIAQMVITMVSNSSTNTAHVQTGLFQVLPVSGIYQVTGAKGSQGGEMVCYLPPNANYQTSTVEKKINRIDYVLWDGRTIPVGTEIEIWGVRADA